MAMALTVILVLLPGLEFCIIYSCRLPVAIFSTLSIFQLVRSRRFGENGHTLVCSTAARIRHLAFPGRHRNLIKGRGDGSLREAYRDSASDPRRGCSHFRRSPATSEQFRASDRQ